jgi:hypothetical protein
MAERAASEAAEGEDMMYANGPVDVQLRDEKKFLTDALRPFHATIVKALRPHFQDIFEGEDDPADDPPEEAVGYAVNLIYDTGGINDDTIAAAIDDVYRDGVEAGLWHVERAIEWHVAFDAYRRREVEAARRDPGG